MDLALIIAALAAYIWWDMRWPSSALFDDALTYLQAAERWERVVAEDETPGRVAMATRARATCLEEGARRARKALRRMPWRLL